MRFTSLAVGAAATVAMLGVVAPASAATYTLTSAAYTQRTLAGSPSAAQKAQTDLRSVSYGHIDGRVVVRWTVRDLRSDIRLPYMIWGGNESRIDSTGFGSTSMRVRVYRASDGALVETCRRPIAQNFTSNTMTVSFAKSCFRKGERIYPWGDSIYRSASGTVRVIDQTYQTSTAFIPNP